MFGFCLLNNYRNKNYLHSKKVATFRDCSWIWQRCHGQCLWSFRAKSRFLFQMSRLQMRNRKVYIFIFFSSYLAFVDVLVCVVMVIFVLIAGCFTSVGFKVWCDEMEQRFPTCSKLTNVFSKFYEIGFEYTFCVFRSQIREQMLVPDRYGFHSSL